jgi:NAD(P)-dependent dehydrogenase (short-subunit alcohol dehydrogenase family)
MSLLKGTKILVFGGSAGIGLAVCRRLARCGPRALVLVGTTQAKLDGACDELRASAAADDDDDGAIEISSAVVDMTDEDAVRAFYARYPDGNFDHVVITAGRSAFLGNVIENNRSVAELRTQMEMKFFNQMCAVLNGHSKVVDGGSFVLFSGILAQRPGRGNTSLSIANAAVEASVRGLANDLGHARGIRINCVSPGMTDTDTYAKMDAAKRDAYQDACREKSPLGRIAIPDDIADSVLYLISNRNVTGQVIVNDAGLSGV